MNKRGNRVPLGQRVRAGDPPQSSCQSSAPPDGCPVRHCWVADAVDHLGEKRPGLLVEWRRTSSAWEGRVVYAAQLRPGEWALVEEWLPAELLTPV